MDRIDWVKQYMKEGRSVRFMATELKVNRLTIMRDIEKTPFWYRIPYKLKSRKYRGHLK